MSYVLNDFKSELFLYYQVKKKSVLPAPAVKHSGGFRPFPLHPLTPAARVPNFPCRRSALLRVKMSPARLRPAGKFHKTGGEIRGSSAPARAAPFAVALRCATSRPHYPLKIRRGLEAA